MNLPAKDVCGVSAHAFRPFGMTYALNTGCGFPVEGDQMAVHSHAETLHAHAREAIVIAEAPVQSALLALGRLIFGGYFLYSGLGHLMNHVVMAGYASTRGVPFPDLAVLATGVLLGIGGLAIMTGAAPRFGAAAIALFLVIVTPVMHAFWHDPTLAERAADMANFTKNIGLLGATAIVAATPETWQPLVRRAQPEEEA
jgi:uncharacterized membrane protein YphA (DoxX/SURF4 family)